MKEPLATSGITQEEVINWGGQDVFNQAIGLCNSGDVGEVEYDDDTLTVSGKINQPGGWAMSVKFRLERGGRIHSECPCATNQRYGMVCEHVVAVGYALYLQERDELDAAEARARADGGSPDDDEAAAPDDGEQIIEVPMEPSFYALISGSRASLSIELDAWYGDIDFPACSVQANRTVWLESPDDDLVRRTRSLKAEREAVAMLKKWGFENGYTDGDLKLYLTDPQKVLAFLGRGYPNLRRRPNWKVDLAPKLSELYNSFKFIVPVVKVADAPGGAFDVSYSFETGKDGESIPPVEIQAAINRGDGALLRDGRVYMLDSDAVEKMHDIFRDCCATQNGAPRGWFRVRGVYAPYVRASIESILDAVDLDDDRAPAWRQASEHRGDADAKYEPLSLGTLDGVLRPYQKQGVYWMRFLEESGFCGLLADEMGLGKTLQTLTWLSLPRARGDSGMRLPALIVCPTSLVRNWEAEAAKFTPWAKTLVVSGPDRAASFALIESADVVVTSYALLQRDFDTAYLGRRFSAVVLDEAQNIKNRDTKNAKAVKMLDAATRLVLTGTPIENSVADVWSIFDFLMPGYLGDYESFKTGYEDPIRDNADRDALDKLRRKLAPFMLRRVKKSVAKDLPDKIVKVSYCPMSDDAQREYAAALAQARRTAGDLVKAKGFAKSKFEILALLMKLRKIASQAKVEPFMEQLLSAVEGGHKILVFSQFVTMLKTLSEELRRAGVPFCYLDGSTKDRIGECAKFNRSPDIPVFLISLMAGGTGLNLTGADMVMHYDPWWNPAVEDQATDRAHRIGQKKTVYVMKMIASGSVEERVLALQRRKQAVISATVATTDAAVMEALTAADLNELLR